MALPEKPPPGSVRIRVKVRGNGPPVGWAGEAWTSEWRTFDAFPAHVEDLRAETGKLMIEWPAGHKFKDGSSPVDPTAFVAEPEVPQTSADAVAAAKTESTYHATKAAAAEHELKDLLVSFSALERDTDAKVSAITAQLREAEGRLVQSEKERVEQYQAMTSADTKLSASIAHAQAEARGLIDTAQAKADSEIAIVKADCDALIAAAQAEIGQLTSENEALKAKLAAIPAADSKPKGK